MKKILIFLLLLGSVAMSFGQSTRFKLKQLAPCPDGGNCVIITDTLGNQQYHPIADICNTCLGDNLVFNLCGLEVGTATWEFYICDRDSNIVKTITIPAPPDNNTQNTTSSTDGSVTIGTLPNPDGTINYDLSVDLFNVDTTGLKDFVAACIPPDNLINDYDITQNGNTVTVTIKTTDGQTYTDNFSISLLDGSIDTTGLKAFLLDCIPEPILFDNVDTTGLKDFVAACIPPDNLINDYDITQNGNTVTVTIKTTDGQTYTDNFSISLFDGSVDTTGLKAFLLDCIIPPIVTQTYMPIVNSLGDTIGYTNNTFVDGVITDSDIVLFPIQNITYIHITDTLNGIIIDSVFDSNGNFLTVGKCYLCDEENIDPCDPLLSNLDCDSGNETNGEECALGLDPNNPSDDCLVQGLQNGLTIEQAAFSGNCDVCALIGTDSTSTIATSDFDMGGIDNWTECQRGTDPLDFDDDCYSGPSDIATLEGVGDILNNSHTGGAFGTGYAGYASATGQISNGNNFFVSSTQCVGVNPNGGGLMVIQGAPAGLCSNNGNNNDDGRHTITVVFERPMYCFCIDIADFDFAGGRGLEVFENISPSAVTLENAGNYTVTMDPSGGITGVTSGSLLTNNAMDQLCWQGEQPITQFSFDAYNTFQNTTATVILNGFTGTICPGPCDN